MGTGPAARDSNSEDIEMSMSVWIERLVRPLASRKVRVALVTVLAAYAAEYGLGCSEEMLLTVVSLGVALILGIAHEDAGRAQAEESNCEVGGKK
jgi:hypothetical protein